jgi:hypothetical protein
VCQVLVPDFYQDVKDVTTAELTAFDEVGTHIRPPVVDYLKNLTRNTANIECFDSKHGKMRPVCFCTFSAMLL